MLPRICTYVCTDLLQIFSISMANQKYSHPLVLYILGTIFIMVITKYFNAMSSWIVNLGKIRRYGSIFKLLILFWGKAAKFKILLHYSIVANYTMCTFKKDCRTIILGAFFGTQKHFLFATFFKQVSHLTYFLSIQ